LTRRGPDGIIQHAGRRWSLSSGGHPSKASAGEDKMKPNRADKVLLSATTPSTSSTTKPASAASDRGQARSSPYRAPGDARARIAPGRPPRWQPKENILQVVAATGRFETLGRAIAAAGLTSTLSETGPFTLFAPTDQAFAKMSSTELSALLADQKRLREVLSYHVVPSKVRAPRHERPLSVTTLDGKELEISVVPEDGGYRVSDARIVKTNVRASNGVIHAIDTVLTPR
jgi:uncharacterized surface protein with fasciclin (FAS1) repeats